MICSFNTQPPEGGWFKVVAGRVSNICFNTQPPEGGWVRPTCWFLSLHRFNTQPPEGGWAVESPLRSIGHVSTHSRPKAAGYSATGRPSRIRCFNTQPPEGGWLQFPHIRPPPSRFNTQPPEGGWGRKSQPKGRAGRFQHTAARRRLERDNYNRLSDSVVSTHSRPKAAGLINAPLYKPRFNVSTHSRPKAAGCRYCRLQPFRHEVSTHSRPKAAGYKPSVIR